MNTENNIKSVVKEKYGGIARQSGSCCSPEVSSCCDTSGEKVEYSMIGDDYDTLTGHMPEADLGLGCGLPTEYAGLKAGDTVVDLGSGAGNDIFVARSLVGESGKLLGIDMTSDMIELANANKTKAGFNNIKFILGEIEALPLEDNLADVVISNCVLNLVPDKLQAFGEIHRVLKPGGHFCVSDIVLIGELPDKLRNSAELYAGCVAGALQEQRYLEIIRETGFKAVKARKRSVIDIPESALMKSLSPEEIAAFKRNDFKLVSITITAEKDG